MNFVFIKSGLYKTERFLSFLSFFSKTSHPLLVAPSASINKNKTNMLTFLYDSDVKWLMMAENAANWLCDAKLPVILLLL